MAVVSRVFKRSLKQEEPTVFYKLHLPTVSLNVTSFTNFPHHLKKQSAVNVPCVLLCFTSVAGAKISFGRFTYRPSTEKCSSKNKIVKRQRKSIDTIAVSIQIKQTSSGGTPVFFFRVAVKGKQCWQLPRSGTSQFPYRFCRQKVIQNYNACYTQLNFSNFFNVDLIPHV